MQFSFTPFNAQRSGTAVKWDALIYLRTTEVAKAMSSFLHLSFDVVLIHTTVVDKLQMVP